MYIYFDTNGTIKEIVNDKSIRQGSTEANKIYCYIEGNPTIDDIWYMQKLPSGETSNEVSFKNSTVTKAIPYDAKRDMRYFKDFEQYTFYVFTLTAFLVSQKGLNLATIRIVVDNEIFALGELTFNVQENVINVDNGITISQYDYLLLAYASRTLNEVTANDLDELLDDKINAKIGDLANGSPKVFDTEANIEAMQDDEGIAVATDTGYIYVWNDTQQQYISTGLKYAFDSSPSLFETTTQIQNEPTDKGLAVATDTGYIWVWSVSAQEYQNSNYKFIADVSLFYTKTESDNKYAPKTTAITHTCNQLQDYSGNNVYPVLDDGQITEAKLSNALKLKVIKDYVTPEMFGAVGDGITDDTNALISCLSYKNVELTANKIYLISDSLTLGDNICIKGNNATLSFINVTTNIDEQAVDGACIYITGNNVTLKDINFVGDNTWIRRPYTWEDNFATWYNIRVRTKALFVINNCDNLFVENLNSKGFRNQLVLRNTTNFKINNCCVSETLADGFFIGYGCSNGIITNCQGEKTDDDFISITADGRYTDLPPHDIIADGNRCVNCWGAYFCTEGSYNISCLNGFASNIHFKPLKFGEFNVSGVVINSGLQTFSNITVLLSETMQGDNNNTLESVACGLGANVDIMLDNVNFIKPLDSKTMMFYINGGKVTLKNSTFTGGSWWFRALTLLNLDNNTFNPNGKINFTGDNSIIKNNVFNKDFSTYSGIIEINTTNATFVKNTLIGYTTTYPITSSSTTLVYEGVESVDANSVTTIKNDTISTSARLAPSKMLSGFVFSNSKLYACIGGNKYVITMTYES